MSQPEKTNLGEILKKIRSDPRWVANWVAQRDAAINRESAQLQLAEAPLVQALRCIGLDIASVWDVVRMPNTYDNALPTLLDHLDKPYPDRIREGIARALGVKSSRLYWDRILDRFRKSREDAEDGARMGLAVAIAACAGRNMSDEKIFQDLVRLMRDESFGIERVFFLGPLRRSKRPEARQLVDEMSTHPLFAAELESWRKRHIKSGTSTANLITK